MRFSRRRNVLGGQGKRENKLAVEKKRARNRGSLGRLGRGGAQAAEFWKELALLGEAGIRRCCGASAGWMDAAR